MDDWEPAVFVLFFLFFGAFIFVFENSAGRDILIAAVIGRMFGCKARYACFCHGASWPRAEYQGRCCMLLGIGVLRHRLETGPECSRPLSCHDCDSTARC